MLSMNFDSKNFFPNFFYLIHQKLRNYLFINTGISLSKLRLFYYMFYSVFNNTCKEAYNCTITLNLHCVQIILGCRIAHIVEPYIQNLLLKLNREDISVAFFQLKRYNPI